MIGAMFARMASRGVELGKALAADVPAERFGRFAAGASGPVHANHPAWAMGHLALYPAKVLGFMGVEPGPAAMPESWQAVFAAGTDAVDDAEGTVYPSKGEIVEGYTRAYAAAIEALPGVDDAVFANDLPEGRIREVFGTVGVAVGFMMGCHVTFHMGQVSTWRRCEGLGSVM